MRLFALALVALLAGCQKADADLAPIDLSFGTNLADQTLASLKLEDGDTRVLMLCGASSGKGLEQTRENPPSWIEDGIRDGRMAFTWQDRGAPDYFFRDASGQWMSATEDGGEVRQVTENKTSGAQVWTITYAATGVTETHNIQKVGASFVNIWTSNKPGGILSPIPASAKIFTANCVQP